MKRVKLVEIATIERARKGVMYPTGTILIQLSASRGQCLYLEESSEVGQQYAVIQADKAVNSYYLWNVIEKEMSQFLSQWKTGINIQEDNLKFFEVELCDRNQQDEIADRVRKMNANIVAETETLEKLKELKKSMLSELFI